MNTQRHHTVGKPIGSLLAVLAVLTAAPVSAQTDPTLKRLCREYWDLLVRDRPVWATSIGDYRHNAILRDYGNRGRTRWQSGLMRLQRHLEALDADKLSASDRLTRELLQRAVDDALLRLSCQMFLMPLEPIEGPHVEFPRLPVVHPFRNEKDFETYLNRLRTFPKQVDSILESMRLGLRRRILPPRVTMEKVVSQLRGQLVGDPEKSPLFEAAKRVSVLPEDKREATVEAIREAIRTKVFPAYGRLLRFVTNEYLPACRESVGLVGIPGGKNVYRKLAYLHTTVHLDPEEIHELGLSEVARLREEMAKVQAQLGIPGSVGDLLDRMSSDPRYRFREASEILSEAGKLLARAQASLPKLFTRLPRANCVPKAIEAYRAPASPVAFYQPPPEDGSRPGYFYLNTYQPKERLRYTLEALTYHEAVPGHHLQIALDQENRDLPRFRRYGEFTAYVEGWALYAEKLGYEMGGYTDPASRFGQLTFEMWRACRLVVDTGIHAMGWSRERAITYMMENTSLAPLDIEAEVDRYIAWPGQALAYKIGELRIVKLRDEAKRQLGERFDLRAFHDALLAEGAMPLDILERRMEAWIEREAAKGTKAVHSP
ncbi:MAG: DUF885 domain-containing protein [Planctomycetota bacterium]|nr:MAG: DUF885 domain-containing protein [Planctomycetota bacterium]